MKGEKKNLMTKSFHVVIEFTQTRVKTNTKLTNFMKLGSNKGRIRVESKYSGE